MDTLGSFSMYGNQWLTLTAKAKWRCEILFYILGSNSCSTSHDNLLEITAIFCSTCLTLATAPQYTMPQHSSSNNWLCQSFHILPCSQQIVHWQWLNSWHFHCDQLVKLILCNASGHRPSGLSTRRNSVYWECQAWSWQWMFSRFWLQNKLVWSWMALEQSLEAQMQHSPFLFEPMFLLPLPPSVLACW